MPPTRRRWAAARSTPRVLEAYGRFLERHGRAAEAAKLYQRHLDEGGLAMRDRPGLARIAAGQKPEPLIRNPADGAAEALFGIAASLTDAAERRCLDPLSAHGAVSAPRPGAGADPAGRPFRDPCGKFDDAIAIYHAIERLRPITAWRRCRRRWTSSGWARTTPPSPISRSWWPPSRRTARPGWRWATPIAAPSNIAEAVDAYDHAEKAHRARRAKRDWPMFYARAMAKEKLQAAGRVRSRYPDGAEAVAGTAGAAELSRL